MFTIWRVWAYAFTHETPTTAMEINIPIACKVSLCSHPVSCAISTVNRTALLTKCLNALYGIVDVIGAKLNRSSLDPIHLAYLKLYKHWTTNAFFSLPPASGNQQSVFYFYEFGRFRYFIYVESCSLSFCDGLISLSIMCSRFICLITCSRIPFIWWISDIPLCVYIIFLPTHLLMDIWTVLLFRMLWIWECVYIFEILIWLVLLDRYPKVRLLDHMLILF